MSRPDPLAVGQVIHGYAQGAFGRDHYDCVKIEAAGSDWVAARAAAGVMSFASGEQDLRHLIKVRDDDVCPYDGCPVGDSPHGLTIPGGF